MDIDAAPGAVEIAAGVVLNQHIRAVIAHQADQCCPSWQHPEGQKQKSGEHSNEPDAGEHLLPVGLRIRHVEIDKLSGDLDQQNSATLTESRADYR